MIEVPSAALTADVIAAECDFISIGTNDLIQYLLAVDRVNDLVANLYEPTHTAVIRTLDMVVASALRAGIPACVCGELAAGPIFRAASSGNGGDGIQHVSQVRKRDKIFVAQGSVRKGPRPARRGFGA